MSSLAGDFHWEGVCGILQKAGLQVALPRLKGVISCWMLLVNTTKTLDNRPYFCHEWVVETIKTERNLQLSAGTETGHNRATGLHPRPGHAMARFTWLMESCRDQKLS